ncbi:hypothetical protein CRG98_005869 [Punica granatum]|uniref:Uncharacterized protein n=1 Tax=Punica granatum TaxID=22663 RepID=A0A2I0KZ69_PUNGR|nr:hypothetical protein CRG98_005869 [Punica granatum]
MPLNRDIYLVREETESRNQVTRIGSDGTIGSSRLDCDEEALKRELAGPSGSGGLSELTREPWVLLRLPEVTNKMEPRKKKRRSGLLGWPVVVTLDPGRSLDVRRVVTGIVGRPVVELREWRELGSDLRDWVSGESAVVGKEKEEEENG